MSDQSNQPNMVSGIFYPSYHGRIIGIYCHCIGGSACFDGEGSINRYFEYSFSHLRKLNFHIFSNHGG